MTIRQILGSLKKQTIARISFNHRIEFLREQGVKIGQNCHIETFMFSTEPYLIEIGDHVSIAAGTQFVTHDGAASWCFRDELNGGVFGRIIIGNNVFVGQRSILLPNTYVGNNCIIGAGSVVRGRIPDNSVVIGNPAKVIFSMNIQKMIYRSSPGLVPSLDLDLPKTIKLLKKKFKIK